MDLGGEATGLGHSLRNRAFRSLYASAVTSTFGAAISLVSVSWIVYHYTGSALDISYLGLTGIGPGIVLGLFAGVLADRYNRRSLMVTADLIRMVGMGALAIVLFVVGFSLPLVLGVMVLVNSFSTLFTPASQAILPRIVAAPSLEDANGLLQSSVGVASSLGSATGGILVVLLGAVWGLGINALTYALSAVFLIQIAGELGRPRSEPSPRPPTFGTDLREGFRYVLNHRSIFAVGFGYLPVNFLAVLVAPFFVVYAASRFGGSAAVFGSLVAAEAAGVAVGSLLVGRLRVRGSVGVQLGLLILLQSGAIAVLALSANAEISVLAALVGGLAIGAPNTLYFATMQRVVPGELVGRVLSIGDFGSFVAIPAGLVAGGLLILRYGVTPTYLGAALGLLVTGVVLLSLRDFRAFGRVTS